MKTQCPNCKAKFNVDEKFTGKQAKCPKCTRPFIIQPFVETPTVTLPSSESPKNVETPIAAPATATQPQNPPADAKVDTPTATPTTAAHPGKAQQTEISAVKTTESAKEEKSGPQPASKPAKKTKLSKILLVYLWVVVRLIAGVLAGLGLMMALKKEARSTLINVFIIADLFLMISISIELLLFYKMWDAIASKETSVTPGKAIGFLFIPVFNLYWALNMIMAMADDYNSFVERRSIKVKELPAELFMFYAFAFMLTIIFITVPLLCVFVVIDLIPRAFDSYAQVAWLLVGMSVLAGLVHFITYIISASKTCDAVNALPA